MRRNARTVNPAAIEAVTAEGAPDGITVAARALSGVFMFLGPPFRWRMQKSYRAVPRVVYPGVTAIDAVGVQSQVEDHPPIAFWTHYKSFEEFLSHIITNPFFQCLCIRSTIRLFPNTYRSFQGPTLLLYHSRYRLGICRPRPSTGTPWIRLLRIGP